MNSSVIGSDSETEPSIGRRGSVAISASTTARIRNDLSEFFSEPSDEIFLSPDDADITLLHAIIVGPKSTPYEGGFFYFFIEMPHDYPIEPPKVKFMTTGNGRVSFNPNLYNSGRVCLSILGTFSGPDWSPVLTLKSTLLSIQSLLNNDPYFNETAYEALKLDPEHQERAEWYSEFVKHETLKVAVLDMVGDINGDSQNMPLVLKTLVKENFLRRIEHYESLVALNRHLDGLPLNGAFGGTVGDFEYSVLGQRLLDTKRGLMGQRAEAISDYRTMQREYVPLPRPKTPEPCDPCDSLECLEDEDLSSF